MSSKALVPGDRQPPALQATYWAGPDPGWTVNDMLSVLRRNLWLMIIIAAIAVGVVGYLESRKETTYQAGALIRMVDKSQVVAGGTAAQSTSRREDPLLSELMVLTGRTVLGEAVDREGFRLFDPATGAPATFVDDVQIALQADSIASVHLQFEPEGVRYGPEDDRRIAPYGAPVLFEGAQFVVPRRPVEKSAQLRIVSRDAAIDYISAGLDALPQQETAGISVIFLSTEPRIGPRVVNSVVEVYKEVNAENARESVRRRREFLEEQLRTTDSLLMVAQAELSGLRSREQAYSAASRFTAEQTNLMQVEMRQAELQADLRMYENALNRVLPSRSQGSGDLSALMSLPRISADPVVGSLFSQLVTYRTQREDMLAGPWARAETHPDVQRLNALIASTEERLVAAVQSSINSLRSQIGALGSLRGRSVAKMSDLPRTEVQEVYLTQNLSALEYMGNDLRSQYQSVRLEEAGVGGTVEIVQLATRSLPIPSRVWVKLMLSLAVGLLLGGGVAVAREVFDNSINTPGQIEEMLLVPNLAVIPHAGPDLLKLPAGSNGHGRSSLEPPGAEAYRILRTNLLFSQGRLKTLVVTSAAPGEGKTMTSANLAAACARQGLRVLLMECDLRRPVLKRFFERVDGPDLASVVLESGDWRDAISPSGLPGLDVLLAGKPIPRATEFFSSPEMKLLLSELERHYDMVILDTSPLLVAADATALGALVDGVLLVVKATDTDRAAVEQAVHQLRLVGANVVGTVLNDPGGSVARYGQYYDYSSAYEVE